MDASRIAKLGPVALLVAAAVGSAFATPTAAGAPAGRCRANVLHRVGTQTTSYAAVANGAVEAYRRPDGGRLVRFGRLNQNGYPTTFLIVGVVVGKNCGASWYRVKLPMRPNGLVGYVRPSAVVVQRVRTRIVVDLSERKLELFRAGKLRLATTVAVGSPATPTPVGRFYVNQRIVVTDSTGPFGPAALGISAFSPVLTGWAQGGPIGIHGTNAPWSIGRAVSNGCIRVRNRTLQKLFAATDGGTPVIIRP
jgi:lipoprotein-anchoring transpeptidase ErfK/SrfK